MADTAIDAALRKRKELQERIRADLEEIGRLEKYIQMTRELMSGVNDAALGGSVGETFGRAGSGMAQEVFESFLVIALRDVGRPLQSGEVVDTFRERGHPIGGINETKTAWNRLWAAKTRNVVVHLPPYGYWLSNEPLLEQVEMVEPKRKKHAFRSLSTRRGRVASITPEMVAKARVMLLDGDRLHVVAEKLGGIFPQNLRYHFRNDQEVLNKIKQGKRKNEEK
jgi:hypothetical protein